MVFIGFMFLGKLAFADRQVNTSATTACCCGNATFINLIKINTIITPVDFASLFGFMNHCLPAGKGNTVFPVYCNTHILLT